MSTINTILSEVEAECARQDAKGYDAAHDDAEHSDVHALPLAAAAVCLHGEPGAPTAVTQSAPSWVRHIWHKWGRRRQLVIAAALIAKEIARLDRAAGPIDASGPTCDRCGGTDDVQPIGHGFNMCALHRR